MVKILIILFVCLCLSVQASNKYVAKTGIDTNAGTLALPYLTVSKAALTAGAGDTVFIRAGTYVEQVSFENNGTSTSRIVIMPYQSEVVVIDGNNYTIPADTYSYFVRLYGNYITIKNIEIRNSHATGLTMTGTNCVADHIYSHHNWQSGIYINGDYGSITWCESAYNCQNNSNGDAGINGSGISAGRYPNYVTMTNNKVHDNWGEGFSTFEATHITMNDNEVYDNWETNMYISDATDVEAKRNFVYQTKRMLSGSQVGFMVGDEKAAPVSNRVVIANNIVVGCRRNFYYWGSNFTQGLQNFTIVNNTFVNSSYLFGVQLNNFPASGNIFKNNIIYNSDGLTPIYLLSNTGITFSNNFWSTTPNALSSGGGDVVGNPLFVNTSVNNYSLLFNSLAINAGVNVGLTTDFLNNPIIGLPDIGAHEYQPAIIYDKRQIITKNKLSFVFKNKRITR